jgi:hypothetical protein
MSTITAGGLVTQDVNERVTRRFDWSGVIAAGVDLTNAGTFIVTPLDLATSPPTSSLVVDQEVLEAGDQKVLFQVSGGIVGTEYRIVHRVTTNESPAQTLEAELSILITD